MRLFFIFTFVVYSFVLVCPAFTQETQKSSEESQILLWKVSQGQKALIPNISLIGSMAAAAFRDDPAVDQGESPSRTGFNLQSLELAIQSVIDPYVRADVFLLFKEDEVELEEGVVTTTSLPWNFQIRAGKMLAKFGRENTQHLDQLSFVDYSFTNRFFFTPEGFHELGVEVSNLLPVAWYSEISATLLQGENPGNFDGTRKHDFAYLGRWVNGGDITENLAAQLGLSGVAGFNQNAPGDLTEIYGADLFLRWKPSDRRGLKWQTEYIYRRQDDLGLVHREAGLTSQIVYQFAKRWEAGVRFDRIGLPVDTFGQTAGSAGLTFLASEFFRLRGQYNLVHFDGISRNQHEAFLQMQFNMGPHGAHSF